MPEAGFASERLRLLLSTGIETSNHSAINTTASGTPTTLHEPKSSQILSKAAIAGIAVGVTMGTVVLAAILSYLLHHRRRSCERLSSAATSTDLVISKSEQPAFPIEIYAGPAGQELRSGIIEESLARMYQSHEISNSSAIYEVPTLMVRYEMPALPNTLVLKIPPPSAPHPTFEGENEQNDRNERRP